MSGFQADVEPHGADGQLALFEQVGLIAPQLTRSELIEPPARMLNATQVEGVQVGPDRRRGIIASDEGHGTRRARNEFLPHGFE